MSSIQLALRHLTSAEAEEVWAAVQTADGSDLADNLAVTIASWWQSPGAPGYALAALASGAPIDAARLAQDVDATLAELEESLRVAYPAGIPDRDPAEPGPGGRESLRWLRSWVDDWSAR